MRQFNPNFVTSYRQVREKYFNVICNPEDILSLLEYCNRNSPEQLGEMFRECGLDFPPIKYWRVYLEELGKEYRLDTWITTKGVLMQKKSDDNPFKRRSTDVDLGDQKYYVAYSSIVRNYHKFLYGNLDETLKTWLLGNGFIYEQFFEWEMMQPELVQMSYDYIFNKEVGFRYLGKEFRAHNYIRHTEREMIKLYATYANLLTLDDRVTDFRQTIRNLSPIEKYKIHII